MVEMEKNNNNKMSGEPSLPFTINLLAANKVNNVVLICYS